jgi:hypothetical protein
LLHPTWVIFWYDIVKLPQVNLGFMLAWSSDWLTTCSTVPLLFCDYQCWVVLTFLWELANFGFYIMLWELDSFSNILCFGLVRTNQGTRLLIFSKLTQFSNRAVFAYTITFGFQIWLFHFSQVKILFNT